MKKWQTSALFITLLLAFSLKSFAKEATFGIVNFSNCVTKSKYGQQEQKAFEQLREKMGSLITDIEKQLNDIAAKFQNPDFVDSLSPEAEQEMKARFQSLNEELNQTQNQYVQVMQQRNMQLVDRLHKHILNASETIAKQEKLSIVFREDACFFYLPSFDITSSVLEEMDKNYDKETHHHPSSAKLPN